MSVLGVVIVRYVMILTNCVDRYLLGNIQWSVDCLDCSDRQYCDIELLIARRYP